MSRKKIVIIGTLLICLVARLRASAQTNSGAKNPLAPVIDSLFSVQHLTQTAISPDGAHVAWIGAEIYVQDLKDSSSSPRRIATGSDVAWSPDSRRLAFISDSQLYVAAITGGPPKQLTELHGFLAEPHWSPDGKTIAILFTENAPRAAGPLEPMTPDTGVVGGHIYEQRLTTVDVATGKVRQLSPADLYVYEYDWSPDGEDFVATAAHGNGDDNWYVAELWIISAKTGQTRSIYKPPLQMAVPLWSPSGKEIAFIGGLMSDEGQIGGDVFVIPASGGEPRDVTPDLQASASWLSWLPNSQGILAVEIADGFSSVVRIDTAGGRAQDLWKGPEVISQREWGYGLSLAADGKTSAMIHNSFQHPPEVWAGAIGEWKQITHLNQSLRPTWGEVRSIHWSSDNFRVQGWLIYPKDFDPGKKYPMIVVVHGGPGSSHAPRWPEPFFNSSVLSSAGYFVLLPNPRGSFGQGEKFTRANVKDFGYGDLRDILAGVDEVVKTLPVDNDRIGITGWSYGGFMSMWAVTQTHRFHAAVVGAGLANWQSYYGENDLDQWMIPFFGASVYDDPAVYARSSPINFVKNVQTPTLVLVGDRDGECPAPQSYEFWHALKTLGVETQFVIYANEGHHIARPEDQRDIILRTLEWFSRLLK